MNESMLSPLLSRRSLIAATGAGALALATWQPAAFAQDATPEAAGIERADHPIIGVWHADLVDEVKPSTMLFDADGTFMEYDPDPLFGVGLGLWLPRNDQTVEVVYNVQRPARFEETDPEGKMFAPDYIPEPHTFFPIVVRFRLSFQVRGDGNRFYAFGTMEVRDGEANVLAGPFSAGDVEGTRLVPAAA